MVPREIDLEENCGTYSNDPGTNSDVASSPVQTMSENQELVLQDPIEPIVAQEEPEQSPEPEVPAIEAPRRSQSVRKSAIPNDYEVNNSE
jgi:hypothetical protein